MIIDGINIGKNLYDLRSQNNISLEQMSKDLNIKIEILEKYEKDASKMKLKTLDKILEYFHKDKIIFFENICEYANKKR